MRENSGRKSRGLNMMIYKSPTVLGVVSMVLFLSTFFFSDFRHDKAFQFFLGGLMMMTAAAYIVRAIRWMPLIADLLYGALWFTVGLTRFF